MLILAIDTSTEQAGLALLEDSNVRAEWSWTASGNHSRHLDRLLRSLFDTERIQPRELQALVVATGPGSFSGLRVGVSFAKGLALALGIPLIGVGTLDAIGFAGCFLSEDVLATLPAGRDQLYVGRYEGRQEHFGRIGDYAIMHPGEAAALARQGTVICGPGADAVGKILVRNRQPARLQPAEWRLRRAGFLAELGRRRLAEGARDQVHTLEPLYLRRPAAEEKRLARQE